MDPLGLGKSVLIQRSYVPNAPNVKKCAFALGTPILCDHPLCNCHKPIRRPPESWKPRCARRCNDYTICGIRSHAQIRLMHQSRGFSRHWPPNSQGIAGIVSRRPISQIELTAVAACGLCEAKHTWETFRMEFPIMCGIANVHDSGRYEIEEH